MAKTSNQIGGWAFLIGVILAVIFGVFTSATGTWLWMLVLLGIIIGLFNITHKETNSFLMSAAILIIASAFGGSALNEIPYLENIFQMLLTLFVPATIVVAIKNVFGLARN